MAEQVVVEEEVEVQEETIDGRTVVGKLQAKVQKLEETQEIIRNLLMVQIKRIDECTIRR